MAFEFIILSCLLSCSYASTLSLRIDPTLSWRIIGGSDAPDGVYPYQISLQKNGVHNCGGTIVHSQWIITAAHCITGSTEGLSVVAGSNKLSQKGDVYKVLRAYPHPDYDPWRIKNDAAILKVEAITFNDKVSKINVETDFVDDVVSVTLSGWGSTKLGSAAPDNLQHIDLKTTTVELCKNEHKGKIDETQICTLTKAGEGACHGDSGGPLVGHKGDQRVLVGIVSWGTPCARGKPDVFTRASSFYDWFNLLCAKCLNK